MEELENDVRIAIEKAKRMYKRKQFYRHKWKLFKKTLQGLSNAAYLTLKNL